MQKVLGYLGIALATIVLAPLAFIWLVVGWSSIGPKTEILAQETFCGGSVVITSSVYHGGFSQGDVHSLVFSYVPKDREKENLGYWEPFSMRADDYIPLPSGTKIPTVVARRPHVTGDESVPSLMNVFIPPNKVSQEEFDSMGACLKADAASVDAFLEKTRYVKSFGEYPHQFGGLAYVTKPDLSSLVMSVNKEPPQYGQSGEAPMVNAFGVVLYNSYYVGNIFDGVLTQPEFEALGIGEWWYFIKNQNTKGENTVEYVERLRRELGII